MKININKFFWGVGVGIIACKILPKLKTYLKPATISFLSKAADIKDDAANFCSGVNEEALENRNERHNKIVTEDKED
jgi:uncharacterized membrane protein YgaE (UPF0421/DUF939 family)